MDIKKEAPKGNANTKLAFASLAISIVMVPIVSIILVILIQLIFFRKTNLNLSHVIGEHIFLILILTFVGWGISFMVVFQFFHFSEPVKTETLGKSSYATEEEIKSKDLYSTTSIDDDSDIQTAGTPVALFDRVLVYCIAAFHSLVIGTTRSGKSRKIVRVLVWLISRAKESMIFNDPKKEMYYDFRKYLKKKGYKVYCLDFRNLQYSDNWNPLDMVTEYMESDEIDEADQEAEDQVTSIVKENGQTEPIWIEGQKALIKSLILSNTQAKISKDKKNYYSVYQTLANTFQEKTFYDPNSPNGVTKRVLLSAYMDSLPEDDIARVAWAVINVSPEKTRGGFSASALATLHLFSSRKLAKALQKSDFNFKDFAKGKCALFVVNPDEKKTYDSLASICYDQAYQALVKVANSTPKMELSKKVHMIYDEFGNMPAIENMNSKITVALSRGIIYHLYVQDFSQIETTYDAKVARTIRSNCNIKTFIASSDYETCREFSDLIGKETIWVEGKSGNYDKNANVTGGGVSWSQQERYLKDPNQLMQADNRNGEGIIVQALYMKPAQVFLPDCSAFPFYSTMVKDTEEIEKPEKNLKYAIPRFFTLTDREISLKPYSPNTKIAHNEFTVDNMLQVKNMFWFWAMRDDIAESVKNHIKQEFKIPDSPFPTDISELETFLPLNMQMLKVYNENSMSQTQIDKIKEDIKEYMQSDMFAAYLKQLDKEYEEEGTMEEHLQEIKEENDNESQDYFDVRELF